MDFAKKTLLVVSALLLFQAPVTFQTLQAESSSEVEKGPYEEPDQKRDKLLGNLIKSSLENYHYSDLKLNDDMAKRAFDEFLKKLDYSKQFLLKDQVESLEKYKDKMDDQLVSGNHELVQKSMKIMNERIKKADKLREKLFKKSFTFDSNEKLQLDPEKRDWLKNEDEFKKLWTRIFRYDVINRYIALKDGEMGNEASKDKDEKKKDKKSDKDKKDKKEKKLSEKELKEKAHKAISKKYTRIFERLQKDTYGDYLERFVNSISTMFDPHTNYLPPKRKEDFDIDISGSLEGIGAVLQEDGDYIKVVRIVPGGPAWRGKELEVDDVILWVSGEEQDEQVDLVGMRVDKAVRYIRGPKDSKIKMMVKKSDGTRKTLSITRDVIQIGASFAKSSILEHKKLGTKIGYIQLPKFYRDFGSNGRNSTEDVRREIKRLKKQKVDAIVLDLRNNGGGALEDARQMSGLFIEKGPIVQIKNHQGKIDVLRDTDSDVTYGGPLVVMTNRFSASASEILAGAMQDYGRAVIVGGEHTHGKGTVQAVLNLDRNPIANIFSDVKFGALKVTIQKFYRVTGASTQFRGITPDIVLPDPLGYTESREQDLEHALPWDKVDSLAYKPWKKGDYDLGLLTKRSQKRIKSDDRFEKIRKSVEYFKEQRDQTLVKVNLKARKKQEELNQKKSEEFKITEKNKKIQVSNFEESLRDNSKIRKEDMKHWKEDMKQRSKEWVSEIQKDPMLEEVLYIVDDMVKINEGKKLQMVTHND